MFVCESQSLHHIITINQPHSKFAYFIGVLCGSHEKSKISALILVFQKTQWFGYIWYIGYRHQNKYFFRESVLYIFTRRFGIFDVSKHDFRIWSEETFSLKYCACWQWWLRSVIKFPVQVCNDALITSCQNIIQVSNLLANLRCNISYQMVNTRIKHAETFKIQHTTWFGSVCLAFGEIKPILENPLKLILKGQKELRKPVSNVFC